MTRKRILMAYWGLFSLFAALPVTWAILNRYRVAHYEDIFVRESHFRYLLVAQDYVMWIAFALVPFGLAILIYEVFRWRGSKTSNTRGVAS